MLRCKGGTKTKNKIPMTSTEPQVSLTGRYSPTHAAEILEISRSTLYRYIDDGKLKCKVRRSNNRQVIEGREILRLWKAEI
nr:MAG TPA: helix-turn-helix domain protein [Caudoviricetes sp.]